MLFGEQLRQSTPALRVTYDKYAPLVREGFSLFFIQISPSDNEQLERDVLRHDVISFGVEPLTKRSQGVSPLERRGDRVSAEGWTVVRRQCAI